MTVSMPSTPNKGLKEVPTNCLTYREGVSQRLLLSPRKLPISNDIIEKPSLEDLKRLNKSTVNHLRTLCKLTQMNNCEGISIPGVTKGAEDVAGMHGRIRLQKGSGSGNRVFSWSKTWMDKQRANIQAYEYLCHIGEAKEWIELCIGEEIPAILELEESLRDGVILAKLSRVFFPELVPKIFEATKLQFRHSDNINRFFQFIERINLPDIFRFELTDLYEKKNIPKVIYCIHALSFMLSHIGLAASMNNLVGKLEFTDEQIKNTQRDLDIAGVSLPNFKNIGNTLAGELNIPEEKRINKYNEPPFEKEAFALKCQSICRGYLLRKKLIDAFQILLDQEEVISLLQACIRGFFVRKLFLEKMNEFHKFKEWVKNIQTISRGYIIRKFYIGWKDSIDYYKQDIIKVQSMIRGYLLRKKISSLFDDFMKSKNLIVKMQSYSRGLLFRRTFKNHILRLHSMNRYSIFLQAHCRGVLLRKRLQYILGSLLHKGDMIVILQSYIRGMLVRNKLNRRMKYYQENIQKIIKVQSFVRGKLQGRAYKNLTSGKNPQVATIKNFIHLLSDSNFDFQEEIEMESLRKMIVQRVRANQNAEEHIYQLDLKIALLVKNMITLDEVIRHQKRFSSKNLLNSYSQGPLKDPFDLKALNKSSREKLELYQDFFFLLQTCPEYFARLFYSYYERGASEEDIKQLESFLACIFGYAQKRREEYFLLKLVRRSIIEELIKVENIQELFERNSLWIRIIVSYNRSVKERRYLKELFEPLIEKIIENDNLDLESDPAMIYHSIISKEERLTGHKSKRPLNLKKTDAIQDPETRDLFIKHLQDLRDWTESFINAIETSIHKMPFGLRYIAREVYRTLLTRFPDEDPLEIFKFIGYIIYYRYFDPVINAPDSFNIINGSITTLQRRNLEEISKMLSQITTGELFDENDVFLRPLNLYLETAIQKMMKIFKTVIDVQDAEQYFEMDEFDDITCTQKPILYIKISDIFAIHSLVYNEIEIMAPDQDDQLRDIIKQLGLLSNNEEFMKISDTEIDLTLNPRLIHVENSDSEIRTLFMETKHYIFYIIRVQTGLNLMEILIQPVHPNDEIKWKKILAEETKNNKHSNTYARNDLYNIKKMSFSEIKAATLDNILKLESKGIISRSNYYQDLLNAIATDIRTKHRRRIQRQMELESARQTLIHLDNKALYLKSQLESYNDYIEKSLISLQTKKGKKKPVVPFTKQYFHLRNLKRSGQVPKFGSHKYSGRQLFDKGVIVSIMNHEEKDYGKFYFTLSSNDVGIFVIEVTSASFHIPNSILQLKLDDLLEAQYNNIEILSLFEGLIKINVNLMLHMIFRKFYSNS
ncbi:hypothetical protein T552_02771 [Pneumocystis carinii B80]|uniref:Ras-GAP domain-containing protein n=1 Tax=Pneumocystis carinii (strain B80) TaxID=1408658 RepID=A0A0W4ZEJ0_PNEC8|nr:hypothetical protein T552_02771 [Pneumocystis carinii B80]KTW26770.1 hypothetical protein T552_02771 [Pneumocystis carinii B80]